MPEKHYGNQVPEPARFPDLRGPLRVEVHDNWPGMYQICGAIPGEDDWEWVEPDNEPHMHLRAEAIRRVPNMLIALQEAYDLLLDMNDRGEIEGQEWTSEDGVPDRTGGNRLLTLMQCIGMTLEEIEQRGVELGLDTAPDTAPGRKATGPEEATGE